MSNINEHIDKLGINKGTEDFPIPNNYFSHNKQRLLNRVNMGGFEVKEDYFAQSKQQLLKRTKTHQPKTVWMVWKKPLRIAAAIILVSSLALFIYQTKHQPQPTAQQASDDEIVNYLLNSNMEQLPETELYVADEQTSPSTHEKEWIDDVDEEILIQEL